MPLVQRAGTSCPIKNKNKNNKTKKQKKNKKNENESQRMTLKEVGWGGVVGFL